MTAQGDIVFNISADMTGLTAAGQAGERSLADIEKAAKTLERQIKKIGEAGVEFQQRMATLTGIQREVAKSARDSASAFDAFDRSRQMVESLRASIDPLFAASKRYEAALQQLDSALEMGTISAREHAQMMDVLSAAYLRADGAAEAVATSGGGIGGMIASNKGAIQNFSYQLQDVAVQLSSGANAATVFAQQGSQVASAFGPWGAAAGAAIAVIAPLAGILLSNADAAAKFTAEAKLQTEMLDALRDASEQLRLERQMAESGAQFEKEQEALNRINDLTRERESLQRQINSALSTEQTIASQGRSANSARYLKDQQEELRIKIEQIDAELRLLNMERAKTMAAQASKAVAAQYQSIVSQLSNIDISAPWQNVLQWVTRASAEARRFASIAAYADELTNSGQSSGPDAARTKAQFGGGVFTAPVMGAGLPAENVGEGGGSSGGGGSNPLVGQVEALRNSLMSQEELQLQAYATQQEQLEQALQQRLLTQQEYAALTEAAQQKHQEAMSRIDAYRYGTGLQQAGAFFGDMAGAMQSGNEQMQRIARTFGAAEALINAWRAASQTLADPSLPFFAKFAAASKVLASGMGMMNAIKSGGRASSGGVGAGAATGGASVSAAASAPASPLEVRLTGIGAGDMFSGRQLSVLLDRLSEEAGDRGYRLMVAR